jgi:Protein of unknown function (DUF3237)
VTVLGAPSRPTASPLQLGDPSAGVVPGGHLALPIEAALGHPSDIVDVLYRLDGGIPRIAHAARTIARGLTGLQAFVAQLPSPAAGQSLDYRAELRRAGQLLAAVPEDGSWRSFTAADERVAPPAEPQPASFPEYDTAGTPRFTYGLEFMGALTVQLRAEVMGHTPEGYRVNFFVVHGEAHGPRLNGTVRPEGGDWMCIRPDGVGEVDIKITYETPDGALLLEQSGGVFDLGPQGYADVVAGVYRGAPPFFATPVYVTADPRWKWINSLQCFGFGRVVLEHLRVECDIYAPRVTSGPAY